MISQGFSQEIAIEVHIECDVFLAFKSGEWSATQLHSIGFQRVEGSIQTSSFKLQHIYKKCVANKETIKLPKTNNYYPLVAIFAK